VDDDGADIWQDDCLPVTWLTRDLIPVGVARAMEALWYGELHTDMPPPAKATQRSSRLAQNSTPAAPAPPEDSDLELVAKLSTVMGAHLLRQVVSRRRTTRDGPGGGALPRGNAERRGRA
jgi:hypothetical protein